MNPEQTETTTIRVESLLRDEGKTLIRTFKNARLGRITLGDIFNRGLAEYRRDLKTKKPGLAGTAPGSGSLPR